jgi:hypothetical protein
MTTFDPDGPSGFPDGFLIAQGIPASALALGSDSEPEGPHVTAPGSPVERVPTPAQVAETLGVQTFPEPFLVKALMADHGCGEPQAHTALEEARQAGTVELRTRPGTRKRWYRACR